MRRIVSVGRRQQNARGGGLVPPSNLKENLKRLNLGTRNRGNVFRTPKAPPPVKLGGGSNWPSAPVDPNRPSVLRVRADCGGRLFTAKLGVVVHYLTHQLLDHLLANEATAGSPVLRLSARSHQ